MRAEALTGFQQVALVVLRTLVGWHFLYEGLYKLRLPAWTVEGPLPPWTAAGFLRAARGPLAPLGRWAADGALLPFLDRAVVVALCAVGLSLMLGLLTRAGVIGALVLLGSFYLLAVPTDGVPGAGREGAYLFVDKTLVEAAAVLVLLAFRTEAIAGLDRLWAGRRAARPVAVPGGTKP